MTSSSSSQWEKQVYQPGKGKSKSKEIKFNLQQKVANTAKNVLLRICIDHKKERKSHKQEINAINRIKHVNNYFFDYVIKTNPSNFFISISTARTNLENFYDFINDNFGSGHLLNDEDEDIGYRIVMFILNNFNVLNLNKAINFVNNLTEPVILSNDQKSEIIRAFRTTLPAKSLNDTIVADNNNLLLHLLTIYVFSSCFEDMEQIKFIKNNLDYAIEHLLPMNIDKPHAITICVYQAFGENIPTIIEPRISSKERMLESFIEQQNIFIEVLTDRLNYGTQLIQELTK